MYNIFSTIVVIFLIYNLHLKFFLAISSASVHLKKIDKIIIIYGGGF